MTNLLRQLRTWTPAQLAALGFGYWWTANAVGAMIASNASLTSLTVQSEVNISALSISVNGWHVLFHLVTGLLGLAVCASPKPSLAYAWAMAALYGVVSLSGLIAGSTALGFIAVDTPGTVVHIVEFFGILAVAVATEFNGSKQPLASSADS